MTEREKRPNSLVTLREFHELVAPIDITVTLNQVILDCSFINLIIASSSCQT